MGIVRRTKITIETRRRLWMLSRESGRDFWCAACAAKAAFLPVTVASRVAGVSERTIYRWVESGKLHAIEPCGAVLICVHSILGERRFDDEKA